MSDPGEVGGYMGLLLGASTLTVLEVVDLIIYHLLRKCHKASRSERKSEHDGEKHKNPGIKYTVMGTNVPWRT